MGAASQSSLGVVLSAPRLWGSVTPSSLCKAWCNAEEVNLNRNQVEWERRRACSCMRTRRGSRWYLYGLRLLNHPEYRFKDWHRSLSGERSCNNKVVGWGVSCERKRNRGLCQEELEQKGSFKNSWWKIPARSARKLRVNGLAKVPAERSGLIPPPHPGSRGESVAGPH